MPESAATLSAAGRKQARVLPYLLQTAQDLLDAAMPETQTDKGGVILHWLATLLESNQPDVRLECLAVVDTETFEAVEEIAERALVIVAVWIEGQLLTDGRIIARR